MKPYKMKPSFLILFAFFYINNSFAQYSDWNALDRVIDNSNFEDPLETNTNRKKILLITESSLYLTTLAGLNSLWYKDYPVSRFHSIDDNEEWLQMDKAGHMTASYYMGVAGIKAYDWAGFNRKEAIWYGGLSGSIFLSIVELLDGFSEQWGASSGDLVANTIGSALCISQALLWDEQKIQLKYSYLPTRWAEENSSQLGKNHLERALKDYNGQTYWLSFNLKSLLEIDNDKFPNWLSLSLGYGAHFMKNPYPEELKSRPLWSPSPHYQGRVRQYYLSFDIDLNRIKSKSKFVNSVLHTFGFVKFPMPRLEFIGNDVIFHPGFYIPVIK